MYFEVWKNDKLIKRGTETLEPISFDNELMYVPEFSLTLPIEWLEYFDGWEEIKLYINNKCFYGLVWDLEPDKVNETLEITVRHIISEWQHRQISVNHAISNENLNIVYKGEAIATSDANDETITASPFSLLLATAQSISNSGIVDRATARAWVASNGDKVAVTVSKIEKKDDNDNWVVVSSMGAEGDYRVTFSTAKGTLVSVEASVEKDGEESYGGVTDPSVVDKLEDIYTDTNFAYPGWLIDFQNDSATQMIDYVYSKQNKLEALTQTMELTQNLFWRVGWWNYKKVEIGEFGEIKPYVISLKPSGETNIHLITEPVIDYDFENVINVATVYSDKSDSGMASLTLREVYNDQSLQDPKFPVVILREGVNNERSYTDYLAPNQPPKIAPNNELEFAVLDIDSIALESGRIIEGAFPFNDLNSFEIDSEQVTDDKRVQAAKTVYASAIRKLIQNRRSMNLEIVVEEVPADLLPGDKVRFIYDNSIWNIEACSSYWKKILSEDDYFYITRITHDIDENEVETNTITLCKWIKVDRETQA